MAEQLIQGNPPNMERAVLPIGYSVLLIPWFVLADALALSHSFAAAGLTLLTMPFCSVIVLMLAELFWNWKRALLATLVWTCLPPILWLTRGQNSEIPFMLLFYFGVYLFWRTNLGRKNFAFGYFLCGVFIGLAMLVRGIGVGLGLVLALVLILVMRERTFAWRVGMAGVLLLGNWVAILPWEATVFVRTGKIVAVTSNDVDSIRDGLTFGVESKNYREGLNLPPDVTALMLRARDSQSELTSLGAVANFLILQTLEDPVAVAKLLGIKLARALYGTDSQRYENLFLLFQIPDLLAVALGAYLSSRQDSLRARLLLCLILLTLYFWGMTLLVLPIVRYMTPVLALWSLMLPGLLDWRNARAARQTRTLSRSQI